MPSIPISDGLNLNVDAQLAPWSSLARFAQDLPKLIATGADLSKLQLLTLDAPAVQSLDTGLSFEHPIPLVSGAPELTLGGEGGVHFEVITGSMFSPDVYGDNIAIPEGQCAVRLGLSAGPSASVALPVDITTFGLDAHAGISVDSYRCFPAGPDAPTVIAALKQSLGELVIPFSPGDVAAIPAGTVVTMGGSGSLKFSADANLLAIANPLATLTLPAPVPQLQVKQGASVRVGASWEIATEFQVRVQKVTANIVRLGWYRKHSSEFIVSASARASVAAGTASQDLFPNVIGAISSDAHADLAELHAAGLSDAASAVIEDAVKKAVSRKLELAVAAEFGSLQRDEAAFLYELDLPAMDDDARTALAHALQGNLSRLADPQKGIQEVRSILKNAQISRFSFKVNLLGIFNFASVSKLALQGTVTWTPSTGELVIVDQATASRIQTAAVNFGADEEKLRQVMAESFLITAAYRGSRTAFAPPQFKSSHSFFRLDNSTTADELTRGIMALAATGLSPAPAAPAPNYGRTTIQLQADYDNDASLALFLKDGHARTVASYEDAGRLALRRLIPEGATDAFRLRPTLDDALWARMKDLGAPSFTQLFPNPLQAQVIGADYTAIRWWADAMHGCAILIEEILKPGGADSATKRRDLSNHLRDVAGKAHEQFGSPWGLVAMYLASERVAIASGSITGPRYVFASPASIAQASKPASTQAT